MHCRRFLPSPMTRRDMLLSCASGFGTVALAAMLAENGSSESAARQPVRHHPAKVRNVIFL
jgi:hypothetical protein